MRTVFGILFVCASIALIWQIIVGVNIIIKDKSAMSVAGLIATVVLGGLIVSFLAKLSGWYEKVSENSNADMMER